MFKKSKQRVEIISTLLQQLTCAKCKFHIRPPLKLCIMGHNICSNCSDNNTNFCCICDNDTITIKNTSAEKLAKIVDHPCRFNRNGFGCIQKLRLTEVETHEKDCYYRDYRCPFDRTDKCTWKGLWYLISNHLITNHKNRMIPFTSKLKYSCEKNIKSANWVKWFEKLGNERGPFIFHCLLNKEFFHCTLLRAGDKIKYRASFVLTMVTRDGKNTFKAKCPILHYENDVNNIFTSWDCVKVHSDFIRLVERCDKENRIIECNIDFQFNLSD